MEEINGIPLVFDAKQDDAFLGNLFPNGLSFPTLEPTEKTIWKEEWKLKSPEEIQKYYFPEAIVTQKNNIALCDTTGVFKNVKIQETIPECPCEKDENGNCNCEEARVNLPEALVESFIHGRKILTLSDEITIWFFSSSDGAKLLRAQKDFKESSSRYPDVLAVFMETDDSFNVFGTVMDFVIGANVKSFFKGDTHWEKVLDFMEKNEIHVSKKDAKKLFDNALSHYGFFKFWRDLFSVVKGKAVAVVLEGIAEASDKIANGIADWKFKEEDWDTSLPGFSHKNAPFIILSGNKHGVVINQKVRSKTKNEILEKAKKMKAELEQNKRKIPVFIYEPLQKLILMATDETYRFYEVMQSFYKEFVTIVEAGQEWMNAFLCGFINGFLDFISGIFSFISFFLKAVKNYADYKQNETFYHAIVLEYAENFIQAMASFDCIAFFKQVLSLPLEMLSKFITLAKSINITFNGSKIAYFTGYIIFAIVQILLEILFTGGSATAERLFAKAGSSVKNVLKKAGNLVDDVFAALTHLIDQIKKGANNFAAYVKKIIDDFFKWLEDLFKSGKADDLIIDKGIYSKIIGKPINLKLLKKLQKQFKKLGGELKYDEESFEYILSREKVMETEIEAITLNEELILLNKNASTSAVYEELIHAEQFRSGQYDNWATLFGSKPAEFLMEKEAAEELLKNASKWKLPDEEIELIKERLQYFINKLKEYNL